ncbi:MAG: sensor histidine kinase [Prolixibacteraceae bacterium]
MDIKRYKLLLVPLIILIMGMISLSFMLLFQFRTLTEISQMPFGRVTGMLIETTLAVFLFNYGVRWLNQKFPWNRSWIVRVFFDFILALALPLVLITFVSYADTAGWIDHHGHGDEAKIFLFILPLVTSTLFLVIVEMIVSVEEQNNLEMKLTRIEKEQINTRYSALKEQLDHHFLFNNLSVLSSLIYEDVEKADHFIQDFSSIYRYVLRINQRNLVSVEEELEFIDNYLHLYKFRFEKGFDFKVSVEEKIMKYQIPPLTLQVLVENAIKHNVVSCRRPLTLSIENINDSICIKNTLQEKEDKETSTKTGQRNLIEKYKLLECNPPIFKIENNEYIAIVPLIKP